MLQEDKVNTATLELIKELQHKDYLQGFVLVGGTALALLLGHRDSVDIDLFCDFDFNENSMTKFLTHYLSRILIVTAFPAKAGSIITKSSSTPSCLIKQKTGSTQLT